MVRGVAADAVPSETVRVTVVVPSGKVADTSGPLRSCGVPEESVHVHVYVSKS